MSNVEAQMAEAAKLPAIRPSSGHGRPPSREALSPVKVLALSRESTKMVMGQRTDAEEHREGVFVRGGGRHSKPEDFVRLAPGFYQFREERLVELWSERGVAYVYDHGAVPGLQRAFSCGNALSVRRLFGLADHPPFARGIPLDSFLCRQ